MKDIAKLITLLFPLVALLGCSQTETPEARGVPRVYTTFYPTTYFTGRIGGERLKVVCPLPDDEDPIHWMPASATISDYQRADLIVVNGAGFEKWVAKVSLPASKLVDTAAPLAEQFLRFKTAVTHSHGTGGQHSHEGVDGHTWLDPGNAKVQADEIRKALSAALPEHAQEFQANQNTLASELDELDSSFKKLSGKLSDQHLLASHPAYNYLVSRYGWNVTNLDLDPQSMPDDDTLAEIAAMLQSRPARVLLWESTPKAEIAERFEKELGLAGVVFSPCEVLDEAAADAGEDYMSVMRKNVSRLEAAIADGGELKGP